MKKIVLSISLILTAACSFSQKLMVYNGELGNYLEKGVAKYTYYIDEESRDRIKHGTFTYTLQDPGTIPGAKIEKTFTGNFNKGLKNGKWIYHIIYKDYPYRYSDFISVYATGTIHLEMDFKDGLPNGNCRYRSDLKWRNVVVKKGTLVYEGFNNLKQMTINLNFREDLIIGDIYVSVIKYDPAINKKNDEILLKGNCNSNGFLEGKWTMNLTGDNNEKIEGTVIYKNGFSEFVDFHNANTGKSIEYVKLDAEGKRNLELLASGKMSVEEFTKDGPRLIKRCIFQDHPTILNSIFNDDNFLYSIIGGDLQFEDDQSYIPNGAFYYGGEDD